MTSHPQNRDPGPVLRLLSLGAGVQSTAVLLLACDGVIPCFDHALFADTGWEPRQVYENLARQRPHRLGGQHPHRRTRPRPPVRVDAAARTQHRRLTRLGPTSKSQRQPRPLPSNSTPIARSLR
jgi:hypothetical protein